MQENKNKVETILFTTGTFLGIEDISRLTGMSDIEYLKKVIDNLVDDYSKRESALEVFKQGDKWKLSIRKGYLHLTEKLLKDCELDRPTQETLAVIAYKNPTLQSDIIKIRGNKAYDHIASLKELDFITAEKYGRTRMLKATPRFYDYFEIIAEQLKSKFEGVVPADIKEKLDKMSEESAKETASDLGAEDNLGHDGEVEGLAENLDENSKEKEISTAVFSDGVVVENKINIIENKTDTIENKTDTIESKTDTTENKTKNKID